MQAGEQGRWLGAGALLLALLAVVTIARGGRVFEALAPAQAVAAAARIHFEPNVGQAPEGFAFCARGPGYALLLDAAHAELRSGDGKRATIHLVGASPTASLEGEALLPSRSHYLRGCDEARWQRDVPHYAKVRGRAIHPGIDVVWYQRGGKLEYDFEVDAGADPREVVLRFDGARQARLDEQGRLRVEFEGGEVVQHAPVALQGDRRVRARYERIDERTFRFALGDYDRAQPLVIDPVVTYASYHGGTPSAIQQIESMAVDGSGNLFVVGYTSALDFPVTSGAFAESRTGLMDAFVSKLAPDGSLVWSTYLGGEDGTAGEHAWDVAIDGAGNVYVAGETSAADFPVTPGTLQPVCAGGQDGFVVKLVADGSALVWGTYYGGSGEDSCLSLAVDDSGRVAVAGGTTSSDLEVQGAHQGSYGGGDRDAFVALLAADGASLVHATYFGGSALDVASSVALSAGGDIHVAGTTLSTDFPVLGAYQSSHSSSSPAQPNGREGWVARFSAAGVLGYSTYLGGSDLDFITGLDVDSSGAAYVCGETWSADFPVTSGALKSSVKGKTIAYAFVTKLAPSGAALVWSTYLGGSSADSAAGIAVDASGRAHVVGRTVSNNFPLASPTQDARAGGQDAFVSVLDSDGSGLVFSTYLGGSGNDEGRAIAVGEGDTVYVAGLTDAGDFPVTPDARQPTNSPSDDQGFVAVIDFAGSGSGGGGSGGGGGKGGGKGK